MLKVLGTGHVVFDKTPHIQSVPRVNSGKVVIGSAYSPRPRPMNNDSDVFTQAVLLGHHKTQPTGRVGRALRAMEII